jgi:hypothetical protein
MIALQLLLATFAAWSNRPQGAVVTYLIEENRALKVQAFSRSEYRTEQV